MTDNGWMSIAAGQFNAGLDAFVAEREQPIEIIAFDACSMASWEVAHSLRDRADFMVGSETTVGLDGFHYTEILRALQENPEMETSELADLFAWSAGDYNEEWTFSVTDISKIDALSSTIDALATEVLADEELSSSFLDHRDAARGADHTWRDYYLDLGDLARVLSETDEPRLTEHGAAIAAALDDAIPHNYTRQPYRWVGGLTIYADLSWDYLADYVDGTGASWSQDTQWDDLLVSLAEEREN